MRQRRRGGRHPNNSFLNSRKEKPIKSITAILATIALLLTLFSLPSAAHHRNGHGKGGNVSTPPPTTEPTPAPAVGTGGIDSTYFGEHVLGLLEQNILGTGIPTTWPQWRPTTFRLWNTYGYNHVKGKYEGISWNNINTAKGVYDWTLFDKVLAKHKAEGTTDLIYTFGYTPPWAAGGSTTYDKPPTDYNDLYVYARAVAQRSIAMGMPIRNWEVWNEPNNGAGTWTGTHAQMVQMAKAIHAGVKSVDPSFNVLTPSPQGNATVWMNGYLAAGGGAYADTMAFHGYTFNTPETILSLISNYKAVFATYGQSGKPIWDTEAMDLRTSDPALQARFLAIYYLVHKAAGVDRLYWYAYDADQGKEWDHLKGLNAVGKANIEIHKWMLGATVGPLSVNGSVYSVPLTKDGKTSLAVWNAAGTSSYATSHTSYATLQGSTGPVSGSVTISPTPILLTS